AAVLGLHRLWKGEPYREADPHAVVARLQDSVRSSYDLLARPELDGLGWSDVHEGSCYYSGLEYYSHFDEPQEGVNSFHTGWATAKPVMRADAEAAVARLREHLTADGWSVTSDRTDPDLLELRLAHPDTGDSFMALWSGARSPLRISAGSDCVRTTTDWKPGGEG
ncbi:hypothetical protein ADK38_34465, partial [Streptomyces varsoviensis]